LLRLKYTYGYVKLQILKERSLFIITWSQWGLQDAVSPVIEEFIFFHDFTLIVLTFITTLVFWVICKRLVNSYMSMSLLEGQVIECVWTLVPAVVLIQVAIPSLILLYLLDETFNTQITIKVIGSQWYWSYEYTDFWGKHPSLEFDSYMLPIREMGPRGIRLLDVDNRTTLPYGLNVRMLVRSSDVLHRWTVPSLGVKVDACPGRLNQLNFMRYRPGIFYGQCSEICGANHRFIPICLEFISPTDYFWWVYL